MEIKKPTTPKKPKEKKAKRKLSDTTPAFQRLVRDMKSQPKDKNGKFVNRTFAEYASGELKKIRQSGKAAKTPKKTK